MWNLQVYLESHFLFHVQKSFRVPNDIIHRVVGVDGSSQVFEILGGIFDHSLVKRAQIRGTMPKRILPQKMMKIIVDELPVKTVIIRNENQPAIAV